jgi:hypothetical protein
VFSFGGWLGGEGEGGARRGAVSHHGKSKIKFNVKGPKDFLGKDEPKLPYFEEKLAEIVVFRQFVHGQLPKQSRTLFKKLPSFLTPLVKFGSFFLWMTANPPTAQH